MKSKVLITIIVIVIIAMPTITFSQYALDIVSPPDGYWNNNGIPSVSPLGLIKFKIHMESVNLLKLHGYSTGFQVYISNQSDGSTFLPGVPFSPIVGDTIYNLDMDGGAWILYYSVDGLDIDTVGFAGLDFLDGPQIPPGFSEDVFTISTSVSLDVSNQGYYLCIDSTFVPPDKIWSWNTDRGIIRPYWGGPYCYEIQECCRENRGNVDMQSGPAGPVDINDLSYLISYLFNGFTGLPCASVGNVDGLTGPSGPVDIADVTYLVSYLFQNGPEPPACP